MNSTGEETQAPGSTKPAGLSRGLFYLAFGGMWMLMVLGSLYAGGRLYHPYDATLDWGPNGGMLLIVMMAGPLLFRCAPFDRGWRGALPGFVAAATVAAMLAANIAAAGVVLWAISPGVASGFGGLITVLIIALALTLPVMQGAFRLTERWRAANVPWREWITNENFRPRRGYGTFAALVGYFATIALAVWLEDWLAAAYPAASAFPTVGIQSPALAVMGLMLLASPCDRRSALISIAAAAVVVETAFAGSITAGVVAVTLQSDGFWLVIFDLIPLIPVLAGTILLVAHKPGGWEEKAADAEQKEETA